MARVIDSTVEEHQKRPKRPRRRLFNVDEYYRIAEAGILGPGERVELIEGEIIEMTPMGSRHAGCVIALTDWFGSRAHGRALLSPQLPVRLSSLSEPEPDLALLRPRPDHYRNAHPESEDVLPLIEVADISLTYDRGRKSRLYAVEGIPEYWVVDLRGERVYAHRRPVGGVYQATVIYERGESLSPVTFPDLQITVDEILG